MALQRFCLLVMIVVLASCTAPQATAPTAIPEPTAPATAAPVPTSVPPTAVASPTAAATATNAAPPTPTLNLPTPPPKITPGPTAAAFPLAAGWWDGAVCYEVFVRSFYDSNGDGVGDLNGLIAKLDYISDGDPASRGDLGANCIWLMPVNESASYHGYDVIDYYAIEQDYGTNEDFKRLVAEADKRGIKIILDLVLNHTSREHPWFKEAAADPASPYRDWYLWSPDKPTYKGPWNQEVWHRSPAGDDYFYGVFWDGMPDLNYRNPAVIEESRKISRFWLQEMGVAGFRMDAIKHMVENGPAQVDTTETHNWLREYRQFLQAEAPNSLTIGEIFDGDPALLRDYYPDQMDYYFEFDVAKEARGAAKIGLARSYIAAVSAANTQLPFQRYATFLTNHDQNRVMSELGDDMAKAKLAAIALLTLPGMPFVYYGEEIGMLGVKPDERIRTPMQWSGEANGGFTTGTPWQAFQNDYESKHVAAQNADPASLLNMYRELIHLHIATPALANGNFIPLESDNSSVAGFLRRSGEQLVLVLINFDKAPAENVSFTLPSSDLPAGTYNLNTLFGEGTAAALTIGEGGSVSGYVPLASLPAQTGFVWSNE
jgi:alpha-amylase